LPAQQPDLHPAYTGPTALAVVSEADMLAKEALDGGPDGMRGIIMSIAHRKELRKAEAVTAGDLMTSPAVTVTPDDTVEHAARMMYTHQVKRLPVVNAAGRLAGVVSRTDLLTVFDRPDEEIRAEIIGEVIPRLSEPSWYSVRVKDGIVTLEGTPRPTRSAAKSAPRFAMSRGCWPCATASSTRFLPSPPPRVLTSGHELASPEHRDRGVGRGGHRAGGGAGGRADVRPGYAS
jgi:hypothetical protein